MTLSLVKIVVVQLNCQTFNLFYTLIDWRKITLLPWKQQGPVSTGKMGRGQSLLASSLLASCFRTQWLASTSNWSCWWSLQGCSRDRQSYNPCGFQDCRHFSLSEAGLHQVNHGQMDPGKYRSYIAKVRTAVEPKMFANLMAKVFTLPPSSTGINWIFSTAVARPMLVGPLPLPLPPYLPCDEQLPGTSAPPASRDVNGPASPPFPTPIRSAKLTWCVKCWSTGQRFVAVKPQCQKQNSNHWQSWRRLW